MWRVYQETEVLSLYECVTSSLCLEEFVYQYISKIKKTQNQTKNKLKEGTQIDIETEEFGISAYYLCHHLIL